jgi:hypothetical protein
MISFGPMNLKPPGIPVAVVVYAFVLAIIGSYLGITALLDPTTAVNYIEGADPQYSDLFD